MSHEAGAGGGRSVADPDREARRAAVTVRFGLFSVMMTIALVLKMGLVLGIGIPAVVLVACFTAVWIYFVRQRVSERRRRANGQRPTWPAQMATSSFRVLGGKRLNGRSGDAGQVGGVLMSEADGSWTWLPSRRVRKSFGFEPVNWSERNGWSAMSVVPIWGPDRSGKLSITNVNGDQVNLWVRNSQDLESFLHTHT